MTNDIFSRSILVLIIAFEAQGLLVTPLHTLPMKEFRKVRNVGDNLTWGEGGGWCDYDVKSNDCECDFDIRVPCLIVREVMHGSKNNHFYEALCVVESFGTR
jgi:hypothetical protein